MEYLLLLVGFLLLAFTGDLLVRGAVGLAKTFRISNLVIGVTVVSFGTSAPELFVSIIAAINGSPDIAMGNVIGSNIANIGLVLGITALLFPLANDKQSIRFHWPAMMLASIIFFFLARDQFIGRYEGFVLIILLTAFIVFIIKKSRRQMQTNAVGHTKIKTEGLILLRHLGLVTAGCIGLVYGAHLLVDSAIVIAKNFQISERIIGVSVVAFGTSLPELATSCIAALKRQTDISIGNIIGSNIFNILAIVGMTSVVRPIEHINQNILYVDFLWMLGISALLFPLLLFGDKLNRFKGAILACSYIIYFYFILL